MTDADLVKALVSSGYGAAAHLYAAAADTYVYDLLAQPLAAALMRAADRRGGIRGPVLDVAAGTGALGRRFRAVVAVDICAAQLAHNPARSRVVADAERLPLGPDTFDVAGCAFGINHCPDPEAAVREMARVARTVGVLTWRRPEIEYAPKRLVNEVLRRHVGRHRSRVGQITDRLGDDVGTVAAVTELFTAAGLSAGVDEVVVTVPWPGADAFLDYRLGLPSAVPVPDRVRDAAAAALAELTPDELEWRVALILGIGQR